MKKFAFKCKNLNDMLFNWLTVINYDDIEYEYELL